MAGNLYRWSSVASDNDDADGTINWSEGQLPSTVNNSARAMMAAVASWRDDLNGSLTTGGSSNAYTIASPNIAYPSYLTGIEIGFKASFTNTAAATLNVNGIGAKAIRIYTVLGDSALSGNEIRANGQYKVRYDSAANGSAGGWMLISHPAHLSNVPLVVVASGQSNMSGSGKGGTFKVNNNVKVWISGAWQVVDLSVGQDLVSGGSIGGEIGGSGESFRLNNIAVAFCHHLQEESQRPVYLVIDALGAQSIDQWVGSGTSSTIYANLRNSVAAALSNLGLTTIDVFLWHQGEADTGDSVDTHYRNLQTLLTQLYAETWMPKTVPFIAGRLIVSTGPDGALAALNSDENPRTSCVSVERLTTELDGHIDGTSLYELGYRRYYDAYRGGVNGLSKVWDNYAAYTRADATAGIYARSTESNSFHEWAAEPNSGNSYDNTGLGVRLFPSNLGYALFQAGSTNGFRFSPLGSLVTNVPLFYVQADLLQVDGSAYFTGGIQLGHATDTTLTRVSAGVVAIEGSNILTAGAIGSTIQGYDATLAALASYNTNGILTQTAADTFTGRTITGTSNKIDVTNGDGVSGNPTLTISATYVGQTSITTLGTIGTGTWSSTVSGATINNSAIGGSTPAAGAFTTLNATGLITATGGQIAFPASQSASADANTLDDYEEGTFTPTLSFGGGATGLTYASNGQVGTYVKIGRQVTFTIFMALSAKGSSTGAAEINGLPFTVANVTNGFHGYTMMNGNMTNPLYNYRAASTPNTTKIAIYVAAGNSYAGASNTEVTNTSEFWISGSYIATA